jgi:predicted phosphodiesterase
MKIQYASDLHLEFFENSRYIRANPLKIVGDILVLAGDIDSLNRDNFFNNSFWDYVSDNYEEVVVVVGNHEFYKGYDLAKTGVGKICSVRSNVNYYYNASLQFGPVKLIVSPLWSLIPYDQAGVIIRGVPDFERIVYDGRRLSVEDFNREHERCLDFIMEEVKSITLENNVSESKVRSRIVVATHHVPSFQLSSPDFSDSLISGAFTSELCKFIESSPIDYWIYGHSHRNIDKVIGNTRCVSNQLGYVFYEEHHYFDNGRFIEV